MKKLAPELALCVAKITTFATKWQILTALPFSPLSPRGPLDPGPPWKTQKQNVTTKAEFKQNFVL